jgi:hypothetical protein
MDACLYIRDATSDDDGSSKRRIATTRKRVKGQRGEEDQNNLDE